MKRPFWDTSRRGATEQELLNAEGVLGAALPNELKELLREHNGGQTLGPTIDCVGQTYWGEGYVRIEDIWCVGDDAGWSSMNRMEKYALEWGLPDGVVIFSGAPQAGIFLDYRSSGVLSISYISVEMEHDLVLASSFGNLLGCLNWDREA